MSKVQSYLVCKNEFSTFLIEDIEILMFDEFFNFLVKPGIEDKEIFFVQAIISEVSDKINFLNNEESKIFEKPNSFTFSKVSEFGTLENFFFRFHFDKKWFIRRLKVHNDDYMAIYALKTGVDKITFFPTFFESAKIAGINFTFETPFEDVMMCYSNEFYNYFYEIRGNQLLKKSILIRESLKNFGINIAMVMDEVKNYCSFVCSKCLQTYSFSLAFVDLFKNYDIDIILVRIRKLLNYFLKNVFVKKIDEQFLSIKSSGFDETLFQVGKIERHYFEHSPYDLTNLKVVN